MYKLLYPSIEVRTALLYRLGSGLGLELVLVLWCNAIAHTVLHVSPHLLYARLSGTITDVMLFARQQVT